jgi:hypothetical protein
VTLGDDKPLPGRTQASLLGGDRKVERGPRACKSPELAIATALTTISLNTAPIIETSGVEAPSLPGESETARRP